MDLALPKPPRHLLRACLTSLFFLAAPSVARAETITDEQLWINLTAMGSVKDRLIYFAEFQPRMGDGLSRVDHAILRGAIGWKLSPSVSVYQGYAHIATPIDNGRDIHEHRAFQQLNWTLAAHKGTELTSRSRIEQRWRSNGNDMGWRLREMLRFETPFGSESAPVRALVYGEAFVALNDTDWRARDGFDQMRSFVGTEVRVAGATTLEIGYLNQAINQSGGRTRINHVASLSLFVRH